MNALKNNTINQKFGFYSSFLFSILTVITFGFAMIAIPPSGPFCPGNCMEYPFEGLLNYYPRDYFWMYSAVFQIIVFVIFIISNHFNSPTEMKIFSFISVAFALISATVLLFAYFTQFAVVPISMMKGETEGIALFTQYNGHGIFIVLEELGFFLMSLSFLFLAFIYSEKKKLDRVIRVLLIVPFLLIVLSFIFFSIKFGIDRSYRFEVAAITINWLAAIIIGILLSIYFHQTSKAKL